MEEFLITVIVISFVAFSAYMLFFRLFCGPLGIFIYAEAAERSATSFYRPLVQRVNYKASKDNPNRLYYVEFGPNKAHLYNAETNEVLYTLSRSKLSDPYSYKVAVHAGTCYMIMRYEKEFMGYKGKTESVVGEIYGK